MKLIWCSVGSGEENQRALGILLSEKGSEFFIVIVALVEAKLSLFVYSGDVIMIGRRWWKTFTADDKYY